MEDTVPIKEQKQLWTKLKESISDLQSLLTNSELRHRLLISYVIWFTTALSYYAIGFSHENFGSDPVIYAAVSGVVEALGYVVPIFVLHWTGRRVAISFAQLISGALLLTTIAIPLDFPGIILAVAMISRMFNNAVYSIIFLFINELFPTVNRGTAMGTCATISHFAGIVGSFSVMEMSKVSRHLTPVICGISAVLSGLSVLLLPETGGKELPDSVEEINQRVKEGEHVSLRNCFKFK
ncbi:organic cation transporter protein [Anabrus simplex]|uniref:organic cation transporter protein n=1 Tax=Anabrus simplex TaxID=316456 RepID=UPI0034DCF7AE